MEDLRFTESHEWVKAETVWRASVSRDTPPISWATSFTSNCRNLGRTLALGAEAAVVESVKAASEIYAPIAGEVIEANRDLATDPERSIPNRNRPGSSGCGLSIRRI